MTDSPIFGDDTTFEEALNELIELAHEDGVDPEGGWKCAADGNGDYYYDIQITTVQYDDD